MAIPKPSPAQARVLKSLNQEPEREHLRPVLHLYFAKSNDRIFGVYNRYVRPHEARISTVRVLFKNKWIEKLYPNKSIDEYVISKLGKSVLDNLEPEDFISESNPIDKPLWNTHDITEVLITKYERHNTQGYENAPLWIYFTELGSSRFASYRVDFWAMNCWSSQDYIRISYEIKISRGDFLNELKHPEKREFALSISNQFYFISPPDLIKIEELPEEAGLIELNENGILIYKKKAPKRNPDFKFTWGFSASLGRQIFKKMMAEQ